MFKEKALGLTTGIFCGAWWFVWMLMAMNGGYGKEMLMLVGPMHPGFSLSFGGAIWMGVLHLVVGFVLGYVFAWLYNKLAK
ncbi:hypothetical protein EXS71_03200 [Candidatus Uhrbacteria bacterium]|nr:hypothetical protein [Candidatus Uhrbacteria bacterium]